MDDDLKKQGYSKEEEYFHKLNQELVEKLKKKDEASVEENHKIAEDDRPVK